MVRRLLLYGTLVLAIAGGWLLLRNSPPTRGAKAVEAIPPVSAALAHRHFDGAHLPPDHRYLLAVAAVRHVVRGTPIDSARVELRDGRWFVTCGGERVGSVSEFPGFAELRSSLVEWAVSSGARDSFASGERPAPGRAAIVRELDALHGMRAADLADQAWASGARDAGTAALGARALAWASAECLDEVGAGDPLFARAWAWNAIAAALDSSALERETVLLASTLGYPAEAFAASERLAVADPIRLYVRHEDERLDARASGAKGTRESRWLAVLRCVERRDLEHWEVAAGRGLDRDPDLALPLVGTEVALARFETNIGAAASALGAVAAELKLDGVVAAPASGDGEREIARMMDVFESLVGGIPESSDGAFLDRATVAAWYRAAFYSALFRLGEHLRTQLSDVGATAGFARQMGDGAGVAGPAGEFQRWYWNLANLKRGQKAGSELKGDLIRTHSFGARLASVTFEAIRENSAANSPYVRQCGRFLQRQLDSRPDFLAWWGDALTRNLTDVIGGETVRAAAARAAHPLDFAARADWAAYAGNHAALDSMARASVDDPMQTVIALEYLRYGWPADSLTVDERYEQLLADHPGDWQVLGPHVRALIARHRDDRARELLRAWLARADRSQRAFDDISARLTLAKSCLTDHLDRDGYDAIEPVIGSGQCGVLMTASELLDRLGKGSDAETLSVIAWQRYPDSDEAQALVVDLMWRHGRHEVAAMMLARAPQPMSPYGWRWTLGPRFAAFEREHPAEAVRAFAAMKAQGLDNWERAGSMVAALGAAGRHESVAALLPQVRAKNTVEDQGEFGRLLVAYHNIKAARGAAAAGEWLNAALPVHDARTVAFLDLYAYAQRDDEVMWVLPILGNEDQSENLWQMRAAAMLRDSAGTPEQRAEVRTHFERAGENRYRHYGRFLLGLETADQLLALPGEGKTAGEVFYWLGLARQMQGDYRGAAEWYERCVDQEMWTNGEHHWAMDQLTRWARRGRSLERLAAEDGWPPVRPQAVPAPGTPTAVAGPPAGTASGS